MNLINNPLTQHVSGTNMPIFRSVRPYIAAYSFHHLLLLAGALVSRDEGSALPVSRLTKAPASNKWWKPYAAIYGLTLLKMGILVPETC